MIDVVIIGAGIAGLTCARDLTRDRPNINVTVLEASDRVGGRVRSIKAEDGTTLDLGAHFIHGTEGNPIYDLAVEKEIFKRRGELNDYMSEPVDCLPANLLSAQARKINEVTNDDVIDDEYIEAIEIGAQYVERIKEEMAAMTTSIATGGSLRYRTVGEFLMEKFDHILKNYREKPKFVEVLKSVFMNYINKEKIESCCTSLYNLDFRGFLSYIDLDGYSSVVVSDNCRNGFSEIVGAIFNDIQTECVRLNHEVTKIKKTSSSLKNDNNDNDDDKSRIMVTCRNGETFYADNIVITVSCEVLKHFITSDVFEGIDIPSNKLHSISKLQLGGIIKIFFKFLTNIPKDVTTFKFYPSPRDHELSNFIRSNHVFELTRVGLSNWWIHWLVCEPAFSLVDPVDYLNGHMTSLSKKYPMFPDNMKVDPETIIVSDWVTNEFYRGSYSYLKPGCDDRDIVNVAEPLSCGGGGRGIHFAGEATSRHFFSTTHGAYLSGMREAARIKSIYGF